MSLLVTGVDTIAIASSAKRAGYTVYAVDYFGDIDLQRVCSEYVAIIKQEKGKSCGLFSSNFKPEKFLEMANVLIKKHEINWMLLSSGLDDHFEILYELNDLIPILGNSPSVIQKVREKPKFFDALKKLNVPHPETVIASNLLEAKAAAAEIGYPVITKPTEGFGGTNVRLARDSRELERAFSEVSALGSSVLVQKFIDGIHASISILATDKNVAVLSINEQLLGLHSVFQREPFGYCGNVVPMRVSSSTFKKCKATAEKIAFCFGLKGSNGIDIVISRNGMPYVIEVNPRFQGTAECVENVLGVNIVESHINACLYGVLPPIKNMQHIFCTRLILYAPKRVSIPNLLAIKEARDIPAPESIIEEGEPLCSILATGKTRNSSFKNAKKMADTVYNKLRPA
ncbi:MAG: ATP-grasp domain-containing protein [Candidatus Bathyarchaeia archaeon]